MACCAMVVNKCSEKSRQLFNGIYTAGLLFNVPGEHPYCFLKSRLKWETFSNPTSKQASVTLWSRFSSNVLAWLSLRWEIHCLGVVPKTSLNSRLNVERLLPDSSARSFTVTCLV